jgi:7,8-dihydropterin-6-yl-methyl-4-(beta-D-ribofuranosyl)aminobenzene 5'-phosphate synthase
VKDDITGGEGMILTVLSENSADPENPELKAEHGFSVHAELDNCAILYDFGPGGTLVSNSGVLGISLENVDDAVLSHGHYDHAGDMERFLEINTKARVFYGRDAFAPRWSLSKGSPREVGIPLSSPEKYAERLTLAEDLIDLEDFVILTAAPGHRGRPKANGLLLAGPAGERLQDDFADELTLVIRGKNGLVVLTGCSHRGILNIVDQVKTYCPKCPVNALVGGFHLMEGEESEESLRSICSRLAESLPESRIYSGHCTENSASEMFSEYFPDRYEKLHTGMILKF